jgi:hypothetical protein
MTIKKSILTREKTIDFLENLSKTTGDEFRTLYLPPRLSTIESKNLFQGLPNSTKITDDMTGFYLRSATGAAVFWSTRQKYLIVPPLPVAEKHSIPSLDVAQLKSHLKKDYYIGIILVRLGSYAIGICRGDKLISAKTGTGLVHGRHRQGGSSSHRFERHRDKQIESFLIRVCGHIHEQLEPYVKSLNYIVYGGARTTILMLQKYCPLLEKLDKSVLSPLLNIPEPRREILEKSVSRIWSSSIYELIED